MRTILVWLFGIILSIIYSDKSSMYYWENLYFGAILIELFGFILLVLGNLVYNEIIILPFAIPPNKSNIIINIY